MDAALVAIIAGTLGAGTPLVYAALGELVTERAGVLNLGVEGMMLMGAVTAFIVAALTGSTTLAILAAAAVGMLMAGLFAVLTLSLMANQVATGLALTLFGMGLSAFVGREFAALVVEAPPELPIPVLSSIPILGPTLFSQDIMVYLSLVLFAAIAWFLGKTRAGLMLRAIGESPESAHVQGFPVMTVRYLATLFGGAMSGVGGAYLAVIYTPMWVEAMTAGRGWIALALVVFATWRPARVLVGAYLFGGVTILQLHGQALGLSFPSQLMAMLPYLATIAVLVLISRDPNRIRLNAPASLGKPFHPEG